MAAHIEGMAHSALCAGYSVAGYALTTCKGMAVIYAGCRKMKRKTAIALRGITHPTTNPTIGPETPCIDNVDTRSVRFYVRPTYIYVVSK